MDFEIKSPPLLKTKGHEHNMANQDKDEMPATIPLWIRLVILVVLLFIITGALIFAPSTWPAWKVYCLGIVLALVAGGCATYLISRLLNASSKPAPTTPAIL